MRRYNLRPRNPLGYVSSSVKYATIHLRLLPAKLLDEIFKLLLSRIDATTPALLVALRSEDELYLQALRVYYAINEFELRGALVGWISEIKREVLGLVRRVVVVCPVDWTLIPQLHESLDLLSGLYSLKFCATNTTALKTFDIPSFLQHKEKFKFLQNMKIEVSFKTERHPGFGGGVGLAAQRVGDEVDAKGEIRGVREGLEKVVGREGEERVVGEVWDARGKIVLLNWEVARGMSLLG